MADWFVISHPDGRRYSVTREGYERVYAGKGFSIEGDEKPADFVVVGVPAPKPERRRPRRKAVQPVEEPIEDAE